MKSRLMIVVAGFVALTSVTSYAQSASPDTQTATQTAAPSRSAKKADAWKTVHLRRRSVRRS